MAAGYCRIRGGKIVELPPELFVSRFWFQGHIDAGPPQQTIRAFFEGEISPSSFSSQALRVKASALFSRADQLSTSWDTSKRAHSNHTLPFLSYRTGLKPPARLLEDIRALENTIAQFITTLIPLDQLDAVMFEDKHVLFAAHILAYTASVQLYRPFIKDSATMFTKCSQAARACVSVIKHIAERDFNFLDPIIGV